MSNAGAANLSRAAHSPTPAAQVRDAVLLALADGTPTRLLDVRQAVSRQFGVERIPESRLSGAVRGLLEDRQITRPKRGYYQLATAKARVPAQSQASGAIDQTQPIPVQRSAHLPSPKSVSEPAPVRAPMPGPEPAPVPTPRVLAPTPVAVSVPAPALPPQPSLKSEPQSFPVPVPTSGAVAVAPASFTELPISATTEEAERAAIRLSDDPSAEKDDLGTGGTVATVTASTSGWNGHEAFFARAAFPLLWLVITGLALVFFDLQVGLTVGVGAGVVLTVTYLVLARAPRSRRQTASRPDRGSARTPKGSSRGLTGLMTTQHR